MQSPIKLNVSFHLHIFAILIVNFTAFFYTYYVVIFGEEECQRALRYILRKSIYQHDSYELHLQKGLHHI